MTRLIFIEHNGVEHRVDAEAGLTVMQVATSHMIPGIVADCGGQCTCATCHVYVDPVWSGRLPAPTLNERQMLECALDPRPNSRLSCQLHLASEMDGLVLHLPPAQF